MRQLGEPRQLGDDDTEQVGHLGATQQLGVAATDGSEPVNDVASWRRILFISG